MLEGYRELAHAAYGASLSEAQALQRAVDRLIAGPGPDTLAAARDAWRAARVPFAQTEALRFGNWFVDEWELQVNAWPIDEGFLDYVIEPYTASPTNPDARANLVASSELAIGDRRLRTEPIQRATLVNAQQLTDMETNVATGYHAIEFLLWGQDLYEDGPGRRPWTDYANDAAQCTDGQEPASPVHCRRRQAILREAVAQLLLDLAQMQGMWGPQAGSYGDRLARGDADEGLRRMLFGLVSLSAAELAGERLQVPLLAQAQEEEQDCFSDDTHRSLHYNQQGVANFYFGRFGDLQPGPSLAELARQHDAALARQIEQALAASSAALDEIRTAGDQGRPFDQLIRPGDTAGHALLQRAIDSLLTQAGLLEQLGGALGLGALNPQAPFDHAGPAMHGTPTRK